MARSTNFRLYREIGRYIASTCFKSYYLYKIKSLLTNSIFNSSSVKFSCFYANLSFEADEEFYVRLYSFLRNCVPIISFISCYNKSILFNNGSAFSGRG